MKLRLLALILCSAFSYSNAQTIDEIIQEHIKNSGGEEAWANISSIKIIAKMSMPQAELKMNIIQKKPNMIYTETDVMGQTIIQAYDGTNAWMVNPMTGSTTPMTMPENLKDQLLSNAQELESDWIRYKEKGHEVTLEGKETIDGVETFRVKLVKNKNNDKPESTAYFFFDTENYIPIATRATTDQGPTPGMTVETKLSDYRETNAGILMPHHMETEAMGQTSTLIFEEVIMNGDIDDSIFKMPEE